MNKNWMRGVLNQKKQKWEREFPEKLANRKEAIANMDQTIIAARPTYKKQLKKKKKQERSWF